MKWMLLAASAALALGACSKEQAAADRENFASNAAAGTDSAGTARPSDEDSLAYVDREDRAWSALATAKDPELLQRILAQDYSGVGDDGTVRNKAEEIAYWNALPLVASAEPPKMSYRQYGDTILARGDQLLTPQQGAAPIRILWTDVWMFRDGQWQVVGSQNATVPAG